MADQQPKGKHNTPVDPMNAATPAPNANNAYHVINNNAVVDESKFAESDKMACAQSFDATFIYNMVGDSIFDAIAEMSGGENSNNESQVSLESKTALPITASFTYSFSIYVCMIIDGHYVSSTRFLD